MYHYGFVPSECYPSRIQPSPYAYLPPGPGRLADVPSSTPFPPVQLPSFYSQPFTLVVGRNSYPDCAGNQVEYHHIYSPNPYFHPYPFWSVPQVTAPWPLHNPYPAYNPHQGPEQGQDGWPEGFTMRAELQWGKLGKVFGPRRVLPEFVKDDLRRVYGTYPKTDVTITYRNGEFLVKGDPKVGEQEYTVEKRVIQRAPTPSASEVDDSTEEQDWNRKKKKKSKP
ncbi:uncharacterized protein LOC102384509 [Alligator sinensis]|uniref:Uncharacterized protein LOC102384509 n=1 Tax=Alligator sinensis TaxID=38654 RepID=A0A1U7RCM8_ALLSI|nr:uncharacterized protein LOC102384509 [Alligator sinensis]XP_006021337.1 uncharacterized protein LOC102384509 [Alligator sinensis]XP_014374298.1 uncharacterized protein LOC102384509 [Alligator sinensis]